jgi:hypothetical protein
MARIIDARDTAFLVEITRLRGLQRELRLVVRAWRRKVRRRLWKGSRAGRYHHKPIPVPVGAPELEHGFENAPFPESDSDPPDMLPAWLLAARWTPLDHSTTQLALRPWYSTSAESKSRFAREPIDTDYTPTSTPPTTPPYNPLPPSSHTSPPRLTLQQLRTQQQPLQRSYQQHFNQATRRKSPSYQRYQRFLPYDHFHQWQREISRSYILRASAREARDRTKGISPFQRWFDSTRPSQAPTITTSQLTHTGNLISDRVTRWARFMGGRITFGIPRRASTSHQRLQR